MRRFKKLFSRKYIVGQHQRFLHHSRHPFAVPIITFIVLGSITAGLFLLGGGETLRPSNSHVVIVSYDRKQQVVPTVASDVGDLLKRLNLTVNEGDVVEPSLDTPILEDNFRVNIYRAQPVTIIDDGHRTISFNAASTPRSIAAQAGVTVYPEDNISTVPIENIINDGIGQKVVIQRAVLSNLNLYGTAATVRSHAKTVGELLEEKNVKVAADDVVLPAAETVIKPGIQIFVTRVGTQIVTTEAEIPSETQTIDDATLSFGTVVTRQAGSPGKKLVTYQIDLKNGAEVGRHVIQEVIAVAAVNKIIARGKAVGIPTDKEAIMSAAGVAISDYPYVYYIINHENALWCATRWQGQINCPPSYALTHNPAGADPSGNTYGYGLCQATPAIKMATAGADWATNPVTQLRWCANYAQVRYGGWAGAYNFWLNNHYW